MQACAVDAPGLGRRAMLGALAVPLLLQLASSADALPLVLPAVARPPIHPRADWATGRPAKKRLAREDVRFLLVHHTQTPNVERPASIPGRLRGMYDFHTGEKGWPDLAYNFLVDPFGGIWEGRTGSLAGPVRGDATGGSQGYAQLCCFIGDHTSTPPTPEAMAAMGSLLGWLASRYAVDLAPGRRVTRHVADTVPGRRALPARALPALAAGPRGDGIDRRCTARRLDLDRAGQADAQADPDADHTRLVTPDDVGRDTADASPTATVVGRRYAPGGIRLGRRGTLSPRRTPGRRRARRRRGSRDRGPPRASPAPLTAPLAACGSRPQIDAIARGHVDEVLPDAHRGRGPVGLRRGVGAVDGLVRDLAPGAPDRPRQARFRSGRGGP